jgi:hypothetical protein
MFSLLRQTQVSEKLPPNHGEQSAVIAESGTKREWISMEQCLYTFIWNWMMHSMNARKLITLNRNFRYTSATQTFFSRFTFVNIKDTFTKSRKANKLFNNLNIS